MVPSGQEDEGMAEQSKIRGFNPGRSDAAKPPEIRRYQFRCDRRAEQERREQAAGAGSRVARLAAVLIGVMFMGSTLLTPLYLLYQRAFGFSEITLTLIYAVYVVGNIGALFFFGHLSDQVGRRRTSLPAIALAGVATFVFLFARSTAWLFVARILSGLAIGIASGTATAWVAELVPGGDKERASVLATTANLTGIGVGPLLAGLLAQYMPAPLRTTWIVYLALLALVAWLVVSLDETVRRPVRGRPRPVVSRAPGRAAGYLGGVYRAGGGGVRDFRADRLLRGVDAELARS